MGNPTHQEDQTITQIIALIEERAGLILRENHRAADVQRAITLVIAQFHMEDTDTLYQQLLYNDSSQPAWQKLLQALTIGETYFFRNEAHFDALRNHIFPLMIARKRALNQRWLRIWSAGCATGEEIYSLAMMLRDLLPDYKEWSIYLIGTDINDAYLEQARQGFYRINSFRGETPANLRDKWFSKHGNIYELSTQIRDMVIFRNLNLLADTYPTEDSMLQAMDMILCQNVTIYFERAVTEQIQARLADTLTEDGWLILGHSEPLFIKSSNFVLRNFPNAVVYQRQPAPLAIHEVPTLKHSRNSSLKRRNRAATPLNWPEPASASIQAEEIYQQAKEAADSQQWDEALALLDSLTRSHPLNDSAHYLRALIYLEQANFPKALGALRQTLYCNPNFILAHYTLGELYHRMGHTVSAKHEWQITQNLLAGLAPEHLIPHSSDLSVEMLNGLVTMQLGMEARNG
jgi:chemotaxis protein methyltransferase CheR